MSAASDDRQGLLTEETSSSSNDGLQVSHEFNAKALLKNKYLVLASILATNGGILFGYDLGVVSGVLLPLQKKFHLTCFQQEMVVSSMIIGALIASFIAGWAIDYFGRKHSMLFSAILYGFAAIIIASASSYGVIIFGRLLLGVAMSISSTSECVYLSEISPAYLRGTLVSFNEFGITLGFLLAYCSNVALANLDAGWRWMFGLSTIFALIVATLAFILPRSPRYLLVKNLKDKASKNWEKFTKNVISEDQRAEEWLLMKENTSIETSEQESTRLSKTVAYSFFIGFSMVFIQQCTGQPNLLFYASTILMAFGFEGKQAAALCSVALGITKLLSSVICIALIDKFDRKKFLIIGCSMIFVSLLIVTSCVLKYELGEVESCLNVSMPMNKTNASLVDPVTVEKAGSDVIRWVVLFALLIYVTGYSLSFGPITWIILGEIFPTKMRGKAYSLTTSLNWGINLLISSTFLDFSKATGSMGYPFLLNTIIAFFSVAFIFYFIPETKGKTLEQIQDSLQKKVKRLCCV